MSLTINNYFPRIGEILHTAAEKVTHAYSTSCDRIRRTFHRIFGGEEEVESQPVNLLDAKLRAKIFAHAGHPLAIRQVCRNWKNDYEMRLGRELINMAGLDLWNATMGHKIESKIPSDDEYRFVFRAATQKVRENWKWIMDQNDLTVELNTPEKIVVSFPNIVVKLLRAIDVARLVYFFQDTNKSANPIESNSYLFSLIPSKDTYLYDNTLRSSSRDSSSYDDVVSLSSIIINMNSENFNLDKDLLQAITDYSMEWNFLCPTDTPPWQELPVFVVPKSIGELKNLTKLSICRCKVQLPESIGNLQNLRTLTLTENGLQSLPQSLDKLSSLEKLFIYDNKDLAQNEKACLLLLKLCDGGCDVFCDPEVRAKMDELTANIESQPNNK